MPVPVVELMRGLSEARLSSYDLVVQELEALGFERLQLKVPVRKDVVKFSGIAIYQKDGVVTQVSQGVGQEGGRQYSFFGLSLTDKAAVLFETVREVSRWLGLIQSIRQKQPNSRFSKPRMVGCQFH
jgi:hypothetical protein